VLIEPINSRMVNSEAPQKRGSGTSVGSLSPDKRANRTSEMLLHMDGYPTYRELTLRFPTLANEDCGFVRVSAGALRRRKSSPIPVGRPFDKVPRPSVEVQGREPHPCLPPSPPRTRQLG
jgi:hypothetical protein